MLNYTNKIERETQERSSNIELLRILSMFLVLMIHYIPSRTLPTHDTLAHDTLGTLFDLELRSIAFCLCQLFYSHLRVLRYPLEIKIFLQPPFSNIVLGDHMPCYRIRRNRFLQCDRPIQDIISQYILPLVYRSVHRTVHTGPDDKPFHRKIDTSGVGYIHSCLLSVQHLVRLLGKSL